MRRTSPRPRPAATPPRLPALLLAATFLSAPALAQGTGQPKAPTVQAPTVQAPTAPVVQAPAAPVVAATLRVPTVGNAPALPAKASAELKALDARARAGDTEAQMELAASLSSGTPPAPADLRRAVFWYEQAAAAGDADACWALADLYRGDFGLSPDMGKVADWTRKAAGLGHAEAMYDLGLLHMEGTGVDRDPAQAAAWFEQAADAGIARALFMLGALYEQGVDGAPDPASAKGWYEQAAATGDRTAAAALATLEAGGSNVRLAAAPAGALPPAGAEPPASPPKPKPTRTAKPPAKDKPLPVSQAGVKEIQTRLNALGFKAGTPDGKLDKRTAAAIRAFQKSRGLPQDGRASQALLASLKKGK